MFIANEILSSADLLVIVTLVTCFLYYYGTKTFDHFDNLGIKYVKPLPFFGNSIQATLRRKHNVLCQKDVYEKTEGEDCIGFFENKTPFVMICDPQLIQTILVKDFYYFHDRGRDIDGKIDPLRAYNLTNLTGQKWKSLRQKLSPTFSSGKLKMMFQQFNDCCIELMNYFKEIDHKPIDISEITQKYSAEIIGTCVFGLKVNALRDPNSVLVKVGQGIVKPSFGRKIRPVLEIIHSKLPSLLNLGLIKKEYYNFFLTFVNDTTTYREKNNIERNDYIQVLINIAKQDSNTTNECHSDNKVLQESEVQDDEFLEEKSDYKLVLDDKVLAANTFVFFTAGFETASLTLSYCLYELSLSQNAHIQKKLRKEIITIIKKHDNKITADTIKDMPYLDCIVAETLRKYPIGGLTFRMCTSPYRIPGTSIVLKKGQKVIIPIYSIHHDPEYYPEPDVFDPERFTEENKLKRPIFSYLPFGGGPRMCIALRFVLLEVKALIAHIIPHYEIKVNEKTQIPLQWDPRRTLLTSTKPIYLNFKTINESCS